MLLTRKRIYSTHGSESTEFSQYSIAALSDADPLGTKAVRILTSLSFLLKKKETRWQMYIRIQVYPKKVETSITQRYVHKLLVRLIHVNAVCILQDSHEITTTSRKEYSINPEYQELNSNPSPSYHLKNKTLFMNKRLCVRRKSSRKKL